VELGWEGKPGTSVWLLLRNDLPEREGVRSELESSTWWALPDGTFICDEAKPEGARRLLHLEDSREVRRELVIAIAGKQLRLARPLNG
jgi:hypothetical protein